MLIIIENLYLSNSESSIRKKVLLLNMYYYICINKMALQKKDSKKLLP